MAEILRSKMNDPSKLILLNIRYRAQEILSIIKYAEMILASRVGSAVFATVTKTPLIAISYEPRMLDHMSRCGLQNFVFDWRDLSFEKMKEATDRILLKKDEIKRILEENAEALKKKAELNLDVITKFI
jgi:polysaccharide pyruvyl transferase WcaK-like protein